MRSLGPVLGLILAVFILGIKSEKKRLNDYISHFEGLTYSTNDLHRDHQRARRSTTEPHLHLKFKSHGRNFNLRLRKDTTTFSKGFKLENSDGTLDDYDTSHIYEGELWGETNTKVHGSIINGVFQGWIKTPREKFYVESARRFYDDPQEFHSVIYADSDVDPDPYRHKRSAETGTCGNDYVRDWMADVQNSATGNVLRDPVIEKREVPRDYNIYSEEANAYFEPQEKVQSRKKRQSITTPERNTCNMFLQTDQELWEYYLDQSNNDASVAKEEITAFLASHITGIKDIYSETIFSKYDKSVQYSSISFTVQRLKINTTDDCTGTKANGNPYCNRNIDVSNFLNLNSLKNHNEFCLAYIFTYRDFTGGTLGLAWVGSSTSARGGVCEKYAEYRETGGIKIWKSLNTGIVTIINYGRRVPLKVSTLTFAHEVGHNFGSPHDSGSACTPYTSSQNQVGNYIMFASATSGDRVNNNQFSACSKDNITSVLEAVFTGKSSKINCFEESQAAFCGNYIVEDGEQCDCGYAQDCEDKCCIGRGTDGSGCTRKPNVVCSPSEGPCCNTDCEYKEASTDSVCKSSSDCAQEAKCDGQQAACPTPAPRANLTSCNKNSQVCVMGECKGSICDKIGWELCYLTSQDIDETLSTSERTQQLCYVSCKNPGNSSKCVSTSEFNKAELDKAENKPLRDLLSELDKPSGIMMPPGAACDNFIGYCDVFSKCRGVDAEGPLARLKNLLFNPETFQTIKDWIITNWWAVLLMAVGLVVFMGLFIKVCSVHTPSSNPKKKKHRKISLKPNPRHRGSGPPPPYTTGQGNPGGPSRGHGKGHNIDNRGRGGGQPRNPQQYEMKHARV
ncbi:unnamed protein product [Owenia fusiformis]|uniref:ADAM10 endopeptidase n=1 Tax=Owenia fusiformis TaxID=6347 RepID=A0A8S4PBA6_OWEFU|nr:unnamed protein product [Owenia fusiformis]